MSLKAKIEAVVYAAEEPVTLAQLAALFADEAFEWKRAKEAEKAAQEAAERAAAMPAESQEAAVLAVVPELEGEASVTVEPVIASMEISGSEEPEQPEPSMEASPAIQPEEPVVETNEASAAEPEAAQSEPAEAPSPETMEEAPVAEEPVKPLDPAQLEAEQKRAARQRDREVREILRMLLDELVSEYQISDRGIEIREIASGFRFATKPEYHDGVRAFVKSLKPPMKLSLQALETLAVIAYKQPITAPEVSEVRGVDSAGVLGSLISRKLITTAGRKQVVGRPILYKTTKEFLVRFGLKDLSELPSMEEFEKMATGALAEVDAAIAASGQPEETKKPEAEAAEEPQKDANAEEASAVASDAEPEQAETASVEPEAPASEEAESPAATETATEDVAQSQEPEEPKHAQMTEQETDQEQTS